MWTEITCPNMTGADLAYASEVTDAEWEVIAPLLSTPQRLGRLREVDLREIVNAILELLLESNSRSMRCGSTRTARVRR